jgi:hypothetical protein
MTQTLEQFKTEVDRLVEVAQQEKAEAVAAISRAVAEAISPLQAQIAALQEQVANTDYAPAIAELQRGIEAVSSIVVLPDPEPPVEPAAEDAVTQIPE